MPLPFAFPLKGRLFLTLTDMSDELDSLTDEKLSNKFAVEIAGWISKSGSGCNWIEPPTKWYGADGPPLANFATSADAVLPFLEKEAEVVTLRNETTDHRWFVSIKKNKGQAHTDPFARCAAIALIRAKRAEKF